MDFRLLHWVLTAPVDKQTKGGKTTCMSILGYPGKSVLIHVAEMFFFYFLVKLLCILVSESST